MSSDTSFTFIKLMETNNILEKTDANKKNWSSVVFVLGPNSFNTNQKTVQVVKALKHENKASKPKSQARNPVRTPALTLPTPKMDKGDSNKQLK